MSLYRQVPNPSWLDDLGEGFGQAVAIDGWDEALTTAWQQILSIGPQIATWVDDYLERAGGQAANVSFGDTKRIVGRFGYGDFNVSYPAALLVAADDPIQAMRDAILTVLDRHVMKSDLGLPLLSSLVAAD